MGLLFLALAIGGLYLFAEHLGLPKEQFYFALATLGISFLI